MSGKIKVRVGQIWSNGVATIRITRLEPVVIGYYVYVDLGQGEQYFGSTDVDGYSTHWHSDWKLIDEALPDTLPSAKINDMSDWRAWRHDNTNPGECACGIRREMCSYHR